MKIDRIDEKLSNNMNHLRKSGVIKDSKESGR